MKGLHISQDLNLPLEAATTAQAILAIRGAGKSYTSRVFAEELAKAGVQTVIIDPTGVHYGVRSSSDGKGDGLPFIIMGGNHADVPLEETAGEVVSEFVVDSGRSVVLDLSLLRKAAQKRFMADFAEHLYHLKGRPGKQSPLHIVLDEADRCAPQKPQPEFMRLLGAIEDWVRLGRSRGFGVSMITQRAAVLNKDILTQVETLIVLRTTSPQDRKAISAWVEENASDEAFEEIKASLSKMKNGQAWVWSPLLEILKQVQVRRINTFDSMATPKIGEVKAEPKKMAPVDLEALKGRIAETIERSKQNDPAELRKQIASLKALVGKQPAVAFKDVVKEVKVEVPVIKDSQIKAVEAVICKAGAISEKMIQAVTDLAKALSSARKTSEPQGNRVFTQIYSDPVKFAPTPKLERPPLSKATGGDATLGKGERAILKVIAQYTDQGGATREQITVMTGYKRSSRDTYLQRLVQGGFVESRGSFSSVIVATPKGIEALGSDYEPLPTGEALRSYWLNRLGGGEKAILEVLISAYPEAMDKDRISEATEYQRSSRDTYLQRLSARQLVICDRGSAKASSVLFSEAVPA